MSSVTRVAGAALPDREADFVLRPQAGEAPTTVSTAAGATGKGRRRPHGGVAGGGDDGGDESDDDENTSERRKRARK